MKRVKTYLHSRMDEGRINGLALLNVHRDVSVSEDEILEKLTLSAARRLQFAIQGESLFLDICPFGLCRCCVTSCDLIFCFEGFAPLPEINSCVHTSLDF